MKWYVATRFANYKQARLVIDFLIAHGHEVTHDWTRTEGEFNPDGSLPPGWVPERDMAPEEQHKNAVLDMLGAQNADAVVLLYQQDMCGSYVEVGLALGMGAKIHLVGQKRWTIFWALPNIVRHRNIVHFLAYVKNGCCQR